MNREDIIRMAREAGGLTYEIDWCFEVKDLERFFQAAYAAGAAAATEEANRRANASWSLMCEKMVAAEREACAKTVEDDGLAYSFSAITYGRYLAEQIRARSNAE